MNSLGRVTMSVPLLSGALLAAEYGPLCRAAGLFRGVPSGALIGLGQGLAAAGAVGASTGARSSGVVLAGVTAGHVLLGALIGFMGAASERRSRFVSGR